VGLFVGMAKIASKEIFCYGRNFFLTVRSAFNRFCYAKKRVLCQKCAY